MTTTAQAACVYDATLEQHVTVRPGQYFAPGAPFEKTWRLSNSGDCPWPPDTVLAFISGDQLGAPDEIEVELAEPGELADISIAMRAPNANGSYLGSWQLLQPDGEPFGEEIAVQINVGPTPTPRPTSTPLATPTPRPTDTPPASPTSVGPLEMSVPSILPGSCWLDSTAGRWGATLVWSAWGGTGEYEYYAEDYKPEFKLSGPRYDFSTQTSRRWPGSVYTVSGSDVLKMDRWVEPWECGY